jgi:hypothetical protein
MSMSRYSYSIQRVELFVEKCCKELTFSELLSMWRMMVLRQHMFSFQHLSHNAQLCWTEWKEMPTWERANVLRKLNDYVSKEANKSFKALVDKAREEDASINEEVVHRDLQKTIESFPLVPKVPEDDTV